MYIGVLSPQRGFPAASAYASKTAAIASPIRIPERTRPEMSAGVRPQSRIVGIRETSSRKRSASIVRPLRRASKRDEERLVRDREPRRAVEDDAQERRARTADAEQDQRLRHGGAVTSTSARAARPPTVT